LDCEAVEMTIGTRRLRFIGAGIGAGLSGIAVLAGWSSNASMLFLGGLVGIPTAAVLGWREAPRVRGQAAAADRFWSALRLALLAVLIGDVLVATGMASGAIEQGPIVVVLGWALIGVIGLVIFGLPAFALAFVVLWPWTFVIRHLPRSLVG
jgi:hypothetical protein